MSGLPAKWYRGPMRRRTFLSAAGLTALQRVWAQPQRPNIIVVLCDDLGADDLGCAGHPTIRTPNLDRFSTEGIRFTDFYAAAPVCSPSRAGLLTGRTPNRCGIYDWINPGSPVHLKSDETTVATLLRNAGYSTCLSGKWHLNGSAKLDTQTSPGDHGFQHWFATQNNAAPSQENPTNFVRNGKPVGALTGYSSDIIVEEATNWLRGLRRDQPYFLYLAYHSPHEPIATAPEFTDLYPSAMKRGEALYYGNVTQLDRSFGRLMEALNQRGDTGNTIVLFSSDNGPEWLNRYAGSWRSHGITGLLRSQKLSLYEGGIRVPGMLRWPGRVAPRQVSAEPVSTLDLLPTLCELTGIALPRKKLDGMSIMPLIGGKPLKRTDPLHWHYCNTIDPPRAALRDGDWKLLGFAEKDEGRRAGGGFRIPDLPRVKDTALARYELYNLRSDPREQNDLAAREPARVQQLSHVLNRIDAEVRAESPVWTEMPA